MYTKSVILLEGHVLHVTIVYVWKCILTYLECHEIIPTTVYVHSLRHRAANSMATQKYMIACSHGVVDDECMYCAF